MRRCRDDPSRPPRGGAAVTLPVAVVVLAAAMLVVPGRLGSARLRAVTAPAGATRADPTIRPLWMAIGGAAIGALAWAVTGSVTAGLLVGAAGSGLGVLARRSWALPRWPDDNPADLAAAWTQLA